MHEIVGDGPFERRDALERAPPDPLLGDLGEEPLDPVRPRTARRDGMQPVVRVLRHHRSTAGV